MENQHKNSGKDRKVSVNPERMLIYILGVGAIGLAGYFGYQYYLELKKRKEEPQTPEIFTQGANSRSKSSLPNYGDAFPLRYGSRGPKVKQLQLKLMAKLGAGAVGSAGADGILGKDTLKAIRAAGLPDLISEEIFITITGGEATLIFNPSQVAENLFRNASSESEDGVIAALREMQDTSHYESVNNYYKNIRALRNSFMGRTIVTDLLNYVFTTSSPAKERVKTELRRIGLKENAGKWSLSGIYGLRDVITITNTWVRDAKGNIIQVKKNTILGEETGARNAMTYFRALDNTIAMVPTRDVGYLR
ncbi:MAG: hypothetical protein MUF42_12190 [Cytophagaceae bacterium]|nr:hypothetical protein [Cytophagaceae bacterium]